MIRKINSRKMNELPHEISVEWSGSFWDGKFTQHLDG